MKVHVGVKSCYWIFAPDYTHVFLFFPTVIPLAFVIGVI